MENHKESSSAWIIWVMFIVMISFYIMLMNSCSKKVPPKNILISYLNKPIPDSILIKYDCELAGGEGTWLKYDCHAYPALCIYVELDTRIVKRIRDEY